eukprot:g33178.t1
MGKNIFGTPRLANHSGSGRSRRRFCHQTGGLFTARPMASTTTGIAPLGRPNGCDRRRPRQPSRARPASHVQVCCPMDGRQFGAGEEFNLVKELLSHHPNVTEKIGSGLRGLKVDRSPEGSRCFWVLRSDGSEEDFSAWKCVKMLASRSRDRQAAHFKPNWSSWWKPDEEADESRYEKWNPAIADREDWASPEVSNEAVEHVEDRTAECMPFAGEARLPSIPEQAAEEEKSPLEDAAPAPEPVKEPPRHPHENEEWYQKWLRRQRNQPNHVIEIGPPDAPAASSTSSNDSGAKASSSAPADPLEKRVCPDDGKIYTFEELKVAYASEYSEEDLKGYWRDAMAVAGAPSDAKKDDYKQEEWYQKWLRRQQNKNRQIIEIG